MRACAAAVCGAFALGAAAQEATQLRQVEVGLERATRVPNEIVWLRDEVLVEIWRQNPNLGQALRRCATTAITREACAVGGRPPSRHVFGAASYADAGFRPVGGGVFLVAPHAEGAALVRVPSGEILLAAGASVQLVDAAYPEIRIELRAPADKPLPLGNLVAGEPGKVFGLLARQAEAVSASTASVVGGGRIALKSSGEMRLAALARPQAGNARTQGGVALPDPAPSHVVHADVDQGSRVLAYASGEGLGAEVVLYGAPQAAPPRTVVAYSGTITLPGVAGPRDAPVIGGSEGREPEQRAIEHVDIDQGARALAYATGEGNGGEGSLYGLSPVAAPRMAVAYSGTIKLPARELPLKIAAASAAPDPGPAAATNPAPTAPSAPAMPQQAAAPAAGGANPDVARLRAEVEAEIERDRARLVAATQQSCDSPASIRQGCTVKTPRRFAFAG